jgi:hypothetical protein
MKSKNHSKVLYKEVSSLNRIIVYSIWVFVLVFLALAVKSMKFNDKMIFFSISGFIFLIFLILLFNKLVLAFYETYFSYSFFPYIIKHKTLNYGDIKKIEFLEIDPIADFYGWGFKKSKKYGLGFITNSTKILHIETITGKKISFSIINEKKIRDILKNYEA